MPEHNISDRPISRWLFPNNIRFFATSITAPGEMDVMAAVGNNKTYETNGLNNL